MIAKVNQLTLFFYTFRNIFHLNLGAQDMHISVIQHITKLKKVLSLHVVGPKQKQIIQTKPMVFQFITVEANFCQQVSTVIHVWRKNSLEFRYLLIQHIIARREDIILKGSCIHLKYHHIKQIFYHLMYISKIDIEVNFLKGPYRAECYQVLLMSCTYPHQTAYLKGQYISK